MSRFSKITTPRGVNSSKSIIENCKSGLACFIILAVMLSMLPVTAYAGMSYEYIISNAGENYQIVNAYDSELIATCPTFAETLTFCTTADPAILLESDGAPLELNSSASIGTSNALISGTYYGSVVFTYLDGADGGFVIPNGRTVNFSSLEVTTESFGTTSSFAPIIVNSGGTLNIGNDSSLSANFEESTNNYVVRNNGTINMENGTVCGDAETIAGIYNSSTGILNISGGLVSSTAYGSIAIINYGNMTISGSATISALSSSIYVGGGADTSVNISGGTVESTYYGDGAIYLSSSTLSTVTITGGIINSFNDNTLVLARGSSAGAKIALYGLNIYRSSSGNISIKGINVDSKYVITDTNFGMATVGADGFGDNLSFGAWTSDNEGETSVSALNPEAVGNLSVSSNENVYLKAVFSDTWSPWLYDGTTTRLSDAQGTLSFSSNDEGTYYYKVVQNNAPVPAIDPVDTETYDGSGQVAGSNKAATISGISLSAGAKDIYLIVKDTGGNTSDTLKMDFLPFGTKGSGYWNDPILIGTADELEMFAAGEYEFDRCYSLTSDIDMTGRVWTPVGAVAGGNTASTYSGEEFQGEFYGDNHTISNLTTEGINCNFQGFFGWIGEYAGIMDLILTDVNISGANSVGAMAGVNQGTINNCSVSGEVTATAQGAGGLIGYNQAGTVENCHAVADVTGYGIVGGLFGSATGGNILKSYADSSVTLTDTMGNAGVFAGTISGPDTNIQNCYAIGSLTGYENAENLGGFVGSVANSTINNCYVSASIQMYESPSAHAFGHGTGITLTNCFYDLEAYATQTELIGLTGKTAAEMKALTTFAGWDFTSIWTIGSANGGYPSLKHELPELRAKVTAGSITSSSMVFANWGGASGYAILINDDSEGGCSYIGDALPADAVYYTNGENITSGVEVDRYLHIYALNDEGAVIAADNYQISRRTVNCFSGGVGSEADPFQITTADQLALTSEYGGKSDVVHFILKNDIDLSSTTNKDINGWKPISHFTGILDGNGKTLNNLEINTPYNSRIGLFSRIDRATIKNLTIKDADVTGGNSTGILVGQAGDVHIEKISVSGTVTGQSKIGGLAGALGSSLKTIINCCSTADVTGSDMVGGLVGLIENSAITNSYAAGTISLLYPSLSIYSGRLACEYIGGLVGADDPYEDGTNCFTLNYYDMTVSGRNDSVGAAGMTTAQMKAQASYPGWDFSTVWSISADINNGYPYLQGLGTPAPDTDTHDDSNTSPGASVVVNGVRQEVGTTQNKSENGKSITEVIFDQAKLDKILGSAETGASIILAVTSGSDIATGVLTGQMVKDMEKTDTVLEIRTAAANYILPASQIDIDAVSRQLGATVTLSDIKVEISISEPSGSTVQVVNAAANSGGFAIMVPAVNFTINCTYGERTVDVSIFNSYVERMIAIPDGVDPNRITTGIIVDADGTTRHVPTRITLIDGKYYAVINSLTNSTYTVVWHPIEFADVANHWARDAINNMGSRMIVTGIDGEEYLPERDMTRAEFAAVIVRALGLDLGVGDNIFTDVTASSWYFGYVGTAVTYNIITGYGNNTFGPNDKITREQAMTMVARAMTITELETSLTNNEISSLLSGFSDSEQVAGYAKAGVAACLNNGVVTGKTGTTVAPKDYIKRAEVAVIMERMLQKSDLI